MTDRDTSARAGGCGEWMSRLGDDDRSAVEAFGDGTVVELRDVAGRLGDLWAFMMSRGAPATCLHEVELALNSLNDSAVYLELALQRRGVAAGGGG